MQNRLLLLLFAMLRVPAEAQQTAQPLKYANAVETRLLDESTIFRAVGIELAPGSKTSHINDGLDQVIITLAGNSSLSDQQDSDSALLSTGEVLFRKKGLDLVIINPSKDVAKTIAIGIKKHWDAEVRTCTEPKQCIHPIQMGTAEIGHTNLLFTSGFVTAYKHDLITGGTLSSSYFSSRGKDYLMLVPLTNLRANFDGQEEELKPGQVYSPEAAQVEVTAEREAANWIMIRVEIPKR
jgi:hypothetical protein